jgi:hypothetical protein
MVPAVKALPAALKRWLRPMRHDIARRPTSPRLIAAIAGVMIPAVAPCKTSARITNRYVGCSAKIKAAAAIMTIPVATNARFQRTASVSAPPGISATPLVIRPIVSIMPTDSCDQLRLAR